MLEHAGSEWKLVSFPSGEPAAEVLVRFAGRTEIAGGAGCNRFMGTYVQRGLDVLIGDLAMTRMMCPEDVMATEARVTDVLARARGIAGGPYTMALFSGDGTLLVSRRDIGPVPLLKLRGRTAFDGGWWIGFEADGFYAPISVLNGSDTEVTGAIVDASLRAGYRLDDRVVRGRLASGGDAAGGSGEVRVANSELWLANGKSGNPW